MKFLIDTNVFIPLEPDLKFKTDAWTAAAAAFSRAAMQSGQQVFVHPAARRDIDRIRDAERRATRHQHFDKYAELPEPPCGDEKIAAILGAPAEGTNEWVDDQLLIALYCEAVDYLVSEDDGLHRKATRLGLADRAFRLEEAADFILGRLVARRPEPPPLVVPTKAHSLDGDDAIFESFRRDYDGFDAWLTRAKRDHRDAWLVKTPDGTYAAIAIVKISDARRPERHLKMCSFKVNEAAQGQKYGELMLKPIFDHCYANDLRSCYTTVLPKYSGLIAFLEQFGFEKQDGSTPFGEEIYAKRMVPDREIADPLQFHIAFGPRHARRDVAAYLVPILPDYHRMLFPESELQLSLVHADHPVGNAISKAYLCHAQTRQLRAGDNLFFYRSRDQKTVRNTGVVEATRVSDDPEAIARFVGRRTVYSLPEIKQMCSKGLVLAIRFRHSRTLANGIAFETLLRAEIVKGPPQSIQRLTSDAAIRLWQLVDGSKSRE